jgi:hypothetical protein
VFIVCEHPPAFACSGTIGPDGESHNAGKRCSMARLLLVGHT